MKSPESPEPAFEKPDSVPDPLLKNPDDGAVVEFPKPGADLMSMSGIVIGPMLPVPVIPNTVSGPPMVRSTGMGLIVMGPPPGPMIVIGPTLLFCGSKL